ncbi:uncharacterized protein LOC134447113 [Engraulis encrasicolus]|uniref:uncharacterized protein LOC134447113 n=1 Tax=Engraulis encrasicolus TaxID=184585 RepID=UPI002FCE74D0
MDRTNSMPLSRLKEGRNKRQVENLRSGDVPLRPGPRVLPPIGSSPQLQGDASSSISALIVDDNPALRDHLVPGDRLHSGTFKPRSVLRPLGKKNLTGLDHAHPLKPLVHRPASKDAALHGGSSSSSSSSISVVSMVPAPPTVAKATGEKSKHVKARRCKKVSSADPRPISSRPDDKSISSAENHGNGCQASQVMQDQEVESIMNALDVLQEITQAKTWIRQENTRADEERGLLTQKNIKSSDAIANQILDHSGSAAGTKVKRGRTQKQQQQQQQQQHSSLPPLGTSTPSHTSGNHKHFGQFGDRLPYVRKTSSLSLSTLEELTEESDRSATVSEAEEERKSKERKRRKSMSVRSARQPNDKESENQQLHIEQQVREESEQQQARRGSTSVAYPETLQQALKLLSTQDW